MGNKSRVFHLVENGSVTALSYFPDTARKFCCAVSVCSFQGNSNTASKQPHYLGAKKGSSLPALWPAIGHRVGSEKPF